MLFFPIELTIRAARMYHQFHPRSAMDMHPGISDKSNLRLQGCPFQAYQCPWKLFRSAHLLNHTIGPSLRPACHSRLTRLERLGSWQWLSSQEASNWKLDHPPGVFSPYDRPAVRQSHPDCPTPAIPASIRATADPPAAITELPASFATVIPYCFHCFDQSVSQSETNNQLT